MLAVRGAAEHALPVPAEHVHDMHCLAKMSTTACWDGACRYRKCEELPDVINLDVTFVIVFFAKKSARKNGPKQKNAQ